MSDTAKAPTSRRGLVMTLGVAAAAAGVGAGAALWARRKPSGEPTAADALWQLTFDTPDGRQLAMADLRGRHLLVNFWATWCPPCVEELPLLDAFQLQRAGNGWQVIGLAIDQPSQVRKFLAQTPVRFPIGMAGLDGTELAKSLGNLGGGLPFTVVLGPGGDVRQRRMGKLSRADLDAWAAAG